jgi:hypothetical protein
MRPGSNSVEIHPQLTHNQHPVDAALVGAGSLWPPSALEHPLKRDQLSVGFFIGVISPKREIKNFKNKSDFGGFQSPKVREK